MFNLKLNSNNKENKTKLIDLISLNLLSNIEDGYKVVDDKNSYEIVVGKEKIKDSSSSIELMIRKTINIDNNNINDIDYIQKISKSIQEFLDKSREAEEIIK